MKIFFAGAGSIRIRAHKPSPNDAFLRIVSEVAERCCVTAAVSGPLNIGDISSTQVAEMFNFEEVVIFRGERFASFFKRPGNFRFSQIRQTYRLASECDFIYVRMPFPPFLLLFPIFLLFRKKLIVHVASDFLSLIESRLRGSLIEKIVGTVVRWPFYAGIKSAREVVVSSPQIKRCLGNIRDSRVVYNSSLSEIEVARGAVLTQRGFRFSSRNPIEVLFVGRISEMKGAGRFVSTLSIFCESGFPVHFKIIGSGDSAFAKNQCDLLLERFPEFLWTIQPWVDDPNTLCEEYHRNHFVILPSYSEGAPKVMFEAMACGAIFVGSSVGAIPDFVNDGVDGFVISYDGSSVHGESLGGVLGKCEALEQISQKARIKGGAVCLESSVDQLIRCVGGRRDGVVLGEVKEIEAVTKLEALEGTDPGGNYDTNH